MGRPLWRLLSGGLTQQQTARNGPTAGLLLAAYAATLYTVLR